MTLPRTIAAVAATGALLAIAAPVTTASAASNAPAATTSTADSATGALVGSLAYRGAEHPYLVGMVADAAKRFGAKSAQVLAAQSGLNANVAALATLLSGTSAETAIHSEIQGAIGLRDRAELSFAAAVAKGDTVRQRQALNGQASVATTLAAAINFAIPSVPLADTQQALGILNAGDSTALREAALGQPTQFLAVEKSSASLAEAMVGLGAAAATQRGLDGSQSKGGLTKSEAYRAALQTAFTEHVYQTGLLGEAVLLKGPRSAAEVGARKAEDVNTTLDATLLGDLGTDTGHDIAVWNTHIAGYGNYLTYLDGGPASLVVPTSDAQLASYITAIVSIVHNAVPRLSVSYLRASYTEHVDGTLSVFRYERIGSAVVYPKALMGAEHFNDLAVAIATSQTRISD